MKEMLTNRILTHLSDADFARLMPLLEPVALADDERLSEACDPPRFVYFPETSVLSCRAEMSDGKTVEVGMVGRDGAANMPALLSPCPPSHSLGVAVAGSALRVRRDELERELQHVDGLRRELLGYTGEYLTQVSQRAACAVLHHLEQRAAVWLLMLSDRLLTDTVEITQERMAQHLGVRRAGVTVVIGELQKRGAVWHSRGRLRIVSRPLLEAAACECYGALRHARRETALT